MYFLYSILFSIGFIAFLPRLIYDALRHGKYVTGFRQRLGQIPAINTNGRPVIWLHCVSVGEAQAARPLARAILDQFPSYALVVSTTTLTGQHLAREIFRHDATATIYFPFDWAWTVRHALRAINPSALLIMETELWPSFLRECRMRHVPVAIVNGRLSGRSFRRYRLIGPFIKRVVNDIDLALMQTEADAERMRLLGLPPERVLVSGNVKFDAGVEPGEQLLTNELRERFHLHDGRPLIVAASTHAPEERIVIEAFGKLRNGSGGLRARLLLAPRHPERFAEAALLLQSAGLSWARRSHAPDARDAICDAILLDTIGELRAVYPLASIVFVGGSIAPTGGHNILEPAVAGTCIITGAHTANFAAIVHAFLEADALVQLPPVSQAEAPAALSLRLEELLVDAEQRRAMATRARAVVEQNRGATERTTRLLTKLLDPSPRRAASSQAQDAPRRAISA